MRTFLKDELERFLEAVDHALAQPVEVIVIGGTAAALHYGVTRATHDIEALRESSRSRMSGLPHKQDQRNLVRARFTASRSNAAGSNGPPVMASIQVLVCSCSSSFGSRRRSRVS